MLRDVARHAVRLAAALWLSGCLRPSAAPVVTPRASPASLPDAATSAASVDGGLVRVAGRYLELRAPVRFTPDHTTPRPGSEAVLDEVAVALRALRCERVAVLGHDGVRDDGYGRRLSTERARAVREYLITRGGLDGARLDAVGFELSRPLVPPSDRARSLAVNLRIEIFLAECSALGLANAAP